MTAKKKTWIIVGSILAVLLIGGAIAWVIWKKKKDSQTNDAKKPVKINLAAQARPAPTQTQRQNP